MENAKFFCTSSSFEALACAIVKKGRFPSSLAGQVPLEKFTPDAREVVLRFLHLMERSGYCLTEVTPVLIRWLSLTLPRILPSACGGQIPPITIPGRHRKLDTYVAGQNWSLDRSPHVFVDLGCGFPPVTTVNTANRFPDWQVYGVDRSFAEYVLCDTTGQYACFNGPGELVHLQPSIDQSKGGLYKNTNLIKEGFRQRFEFLSPLIRDKGLLSSRVEDENGNVLIRNHIADFKTGNCSFITSDIKDLCPMNASVVRCMNLFLYFSTEDRKQWMRCIKNQLRDNGILIAGTNSFGIQARYFVYEMKMGQLIPREFAFSLDNLGHIAFMPWFTLHENDPEALLLSDLSRILRCASVFWKGFARDQDRLLDFHGICRRGPDGFLHVQGQGLSPKRFLEKNALLWREMIESGYLEKAVKALSQAGYEAWINPACDIAVRPPEDPFA